MNAIHNTDALTGLRALPGSIVQCCITSPPYYGLRDYGHPDQIGLEPTPEQYIARLVEIFAEVRRVLKPDGTLWVNIGDSYTGNGAQYSDTKSTLQGRKQKDTQGATRFKKTAGKGLKPKDLIGIPWMLAFALRADGWHLRQDIIWAKPNAMPESVQDRCTKAHEYIFLLSKSPRYYYDAQAIKEDIRPSTLDDKRLFNPNYQTARRQRGYPGQAQQGSGLLKPKDGKANRRSVWTVATRPYPEAHFAVFPDELIIPCVLAGSRPGDIILDPFMGSGTTAEVAIRADRQYLGFEINPDYIELAEKRLRPQTHNLFTPAEEPALF